MKKYIVVLLMLAPFILKAQCNNWGISTSKTVSECKASGSITVTLSNASELSNIQYSLTGPVTIASSSSNVLNGLTKGSYIVKVEAFCGGNLVSKTVPVEITSTYVDPVSQITIIRNSLDCFASGMVNIRLIKGIVSASKNMRVDILDSPIGYTGPVNFTTGGTINIENLISGNYTVQVTDFCGQSLPPEVFTIAKLDITTFSGAGTIHGKSCNEFIFDKLVINSGQTELWRGQAPFIEHAVSIDNGVTWSSFSKADQDQVVVLSGETLKDFYTKQSNLKITYRACGTIEKSPQSASIYINFNMQGSKLVKCTDFTREFSTNPNYAICYPIQIEVKNDPSSPTPNFTQILTLNTHTEKVSANLAFGKYIATYTTADGYVKTEQIAQELEENPYKISITTVNAIGIFINNKAYNFLLATNNSTKFSADIELVESPGNKYKYEARVEEVTSYSIIGNQAVTSDDINYYWEIGRYKWSINDGCKQYFLEVEITENDVYTYTLDVKNIEQTCVGLEISFNSTVTGKANNTNPYVYITQGPTGYMTTPIRPQTGSFILKTPGKYVFGVSNSANPLGGNKIHYKWYELEYEGGILTVDINETQGFACLQANDNEGQIYVKAINGTSPYTYELYPKGGGITGIGLMSTNNTGEFPLSTEYRLYKNQEYDVKMIDACNAATIQTVKILDLKSAHLAFANKSALCLGETLELTAIALPQPTYTWTGPNGFVTNIRNPIISNLEKKHEGKYIVEMNSTLCGVEKFHDTLDIKISSPPKLQEAPKTSVILSEGNAVVTIQQATIGYTYNIYDSNGILVKGEKATSNSVSINLGNVTETTKYWLEVINKDDEGACAMLENISVNVFVITMPKIILLDSCSFAPKLTFDKIPNYTYSFQWQFSTDKLSWDNLDVARVIYPKKSGYYRLIIGDSANNYTTETMLLTITISYVNGRAFYTVISSE